jgi:TDG/mug DNA glycosylase family protein
MAVTGRADPGAGGALAAPVRLPVQRGSLTGASVDLRSVPAPPTDVPLALAELHGALALGAPLGVRAAAGGDGPGAAHPEVWSEVAAGRWTAAALAHLLTGAGFAGATRRAGDDVVAEAVRDRTLADTVGPRMRLLVCGLNPSVLSADVGTGFARPGNRFWHAALAAGLASRPRDPRHALDHHGTGMTDLVKRATVAAAELRPEEYRAGVARVEWLCGWLRPRAVCFVGLAGWRAAVDRRATAGVQPRPFGGVPAYVMPSTSGLNAHSRPADLADHLRAAADLADVGSPVARRRPGGTE